MRARWTASRVTGNIPYFKDKVRYDGNGQAKVAAGLYMPIGPAKPILVDSETTPVDLETVEEHPDLCLPPEADTPVNDPTIRVRSMSKKALLQEMVSQSHRLSHYPHNPYCEVCIRANMKHRRYAHKPNQRSEDGIDAPTAPMMVVATDVIVISKSSVDKTRATAEGHAFIHLVRDFYSGACMAYPIKAHTRDKLYDNLKHFAGPLATQPNIVCKSDEGKDVVGAVNDLGWHSHTSVANRWPHNTHLERFVITYESICRSAICQSGWPQDQWHFVSEYASTAHNITAPASILPSEREEDGQIREGELKAKQSSWEAFHKGEPFIGKRPPFGSLVYYKSSGHPLGNNTIPGLFVGWRIESGMRYRGVLHILDYERAQTNDFSLRNLRKIPEQEVYVPPEPLFPFAEASHNFAPCREKHQ